MSDNTKPTAVDPIEALRAVLPYAEAGAAALIMAHEKAIGLPQEKQDQIAKEVQGADAALKLANAAIAASDEARKA